MYFLVDLQLLLYIITVGQHAWLCGDKLYNWLYRKSIISNFFISNRSQIKRKLGEPSKLEQLEK